MVGYSKLAGADEERTLARLRALRSDLIDPTTSRACGKISAASIAILQVCLSL
jgi:adenylate cyclase